MNLQLKVLLFSIGLSSISIAIDSEEGKDLYEEDCTKCHDSSIFTRKDRNVNNLKALKIQVHQCITSQGYSWFDEDEENVTAYLSESFYKFNK